MNSVVLLVGLISGLDGDRMCTLLGIVGHVASVEIATSIPPQPTTSTFRVTRNHVVRK